MRSFGLIKVDIAVLNKFRDTYELDANNIVPNQVGSVLCWSSTSKPLKEHHRLPSLLKNVKEVHWHIKYTRGDFNATLFVFRLNIDFRSINWRENQFELTTVAEFKQITPFLLAIGIDFNVMDPALSIKFTFILSFVPFHAVEDINPRL